MADTDKIKAGFSAPVAFKVPTWMAAVLMATGLGLLGGAIAWMTDNATKTEVMVEKLDELKTEVRELRTEGSTERKQLREEVNKLRERVATLEARSR